MKSEAEETITKKQDIVLFYERQKDEEYEKHRNEVNILETQVNSYKLIVDKLKYNTPSVYNIYYTFIIFYNLMYRQIITYIVV